MISLPSSNILEASRSRSAISLPSIHDRPRKLRVLVASSAPRNAWAADEILERLLGNPTICVRGVEPGQALDTPCGAGKLGGNGTEESEQYAVQLCEWADLLVLVPIEADAFARMLHGMTGNTILEVLRSWDVSKKIILVPGMSTMMWENPMTKKQLNKVRKKWNWIRVVQPMLWQFEGGLVLGKRSIIWEGMEELVEIILNQAELKVIDQDVDMAMGISTSTSRSGPCSVALPLEIWSSIFEYLDDWELSMRLGVYTKLPVPPEWRQEEANDKKSLDWIILTGSIGDVAAWLQSRMEPLCLSSLCVKLTIKFAWTGLLSYLERNHKGLFWAAFGHTLLPTKASAVFGRTEVLEWWRTSPSFLAKEYTTEAVDGASRAGFIHVLDWWRRSGLPICYTDAALEQASSKGNIRVLEWWKAATMHQGRYDIDPDGSRRDSHGKKPLTSKPYSDRRGTDTDNTSPLRLRVGKSICLAAQNGLAEVVRWWDSSGIPYPHEESVARIASSHGHTNVLRVWKELKGDKMIYDNQVLVGPTKNAHCDVLEWWRNSGYNVEYKTCDIEEALEDCVGDPATTEEVKKWWARNGLNLGVGTSEWMKVKVL